MIDFTAKLENIFNFKHHPMAKKYLDSLANIRMIIKLVGIVLKLPMVMGLYGLNES